MPKLIKELKEEHLFLIETLNKAKNLVVTSDEGQSTLHDAKKAFLDHLKKEDEQLYPALKKVAKNNSELKQILETFITDMDIVSKSAIAFFDKYSEGGEGIEFAKDFGRLYITLSRRINKEESIIYEKYDELLKS
ncbi:MAG: hemerythrin domain-containing protein [Melioribacteraceae bacterium]